MNKYSSRRAFAVPAPMLLIALMLVALGCTDSEPTTLDATSGTNATEAENPPHEGTPRLVLLIVVDQLRGDYLDRFAPLWSGGFARLRAESQFFPDAHQDHAITSTSPGHASIATGAHPSTHGIVNNNWFDRTKGKVIYSVEDDDHGMSPLRLRVPTLGDRIKAHWPQSKVFTMGGKDRSTVLTAGREADGAFWYDRRSGHFTTSSFYNPELKAQIKAGGSGLPVWMDTFHDAQWVDQLFGTTWNPTFSLQEIESAGIEGIEPLDRGAFSRGFPYSLGGSSMTPGPSLYSSIYSTPFIDDYVGELAIATLTAESLGQDAYPDLLAVNFSATDAVGHGLGPDSPELVDTLVRLDRTIGKLLDAVSETIGMDNVLIAFSSDHGVGQVPEVAIERGVDAGRLGTDSVECFQQLGQQLTERFSLEGEDWMPSLFYFDREVLDKHAVDFDEIRAALAEGARSCPRVDRVILPAELAESTNDPLLELFQNNYLEGSSPDLLVHLQPNTLATSTVASHGSANRYDSWVPLMFRIPGLPPQQVDGRASVTDLVPTVAAVLGIPGAEYDGVSRLAQFEGAPGPEQE